MIQGHKTITWAGYRGVGLPIVTDSGFQASLAAALFGMGPERLPPGRDHLIHAFEWAGCEYFVKYYLIRSMKGRLQSLFTCSKSHDAWRNAHRLLKNGIATPQAVAHLHRGSLIGKREHLLITRGVAGQTLRALVGTPLTMNCHRALIRAMAAFLAELHDAGIYHGDFSAFNIIVQEDAQAPLGWRIHLIDLDAIRSLRHITYRRQVKNLDELGRNFTLLAEVSIQDRIRFLHHYARARKKLPSSLQQLRLQVCRRTARRMRVYGKHFIPPRNG